MRPSFNTIVFNVAGLGILVIVAGYMVTSLFHVEQTPMCTARYGNGQQFALQNSEGEGLSPLELQARLSVREWGVLTNARIVETADKQAQYLQVALGKVTDENAAEPSDDETASPAGGVGFVWQPSNLENAKAACLSYRIYMPKDFAFETGGTMPGLYAAGDVADLDQAQPQAGFVSRLGWQKDGGAGIALQTPETSGMWLAPRQLAWPQNRWVAIAQEVVLNTPGQSDGVMRLWLDGQLVIDQKGMNLGAIAETGITGVVADVKYNQQSAANGRLTMSPFVVQVQ